MQEWSGRLLAGEPASDEAAAALRAMGPKAVPNLVHLLRATDPLFHKQTEALLRQFPLATRRQLWPRLVPPPASGTRRAAARALGTIGPPAKDSVPALLDALRHPDAGFAWEAAMALTHFGQEPVPGLLKAVADRQANARQAAAFALGEIRPPAAEVVPRLIEALHDSDAGVCSSAAAALAKIGLPAVAPLVEVVARGQDPLRAEAGKLVMQIYGSGPLVVARETSAEEASRAARRQAMAMLGTNDTPDRLVLAVWSSGLRDPASEVRLAALQHWATRLAGPEAMDNARILPLNPLTRPSGSLSSSEGERATTTSLSAPGVNAQPLWIGFALCLKDQSPAVRELAARCLGLIGSTAHPVAPALRMLLQDQEQGVRAAAGEALQRIGAS